MNNIVSEFDLSKFRIIFNKIWFWVWRSLDGIIINFGGVKFSLLSFNIALIVMAVTIGIAFNIIRVNTQSFRGRSDNIKSNSHNKKIKDANKAGE